MTTPFHDRSLQVLADHAVGNVQASDRELLDSLDAQLVESMEWVAAAAAVAIIGPDVEAMPPSLSEKLAREAAAFVHARAARTAHTVTYPFSHVRAPRRHVRPWAAVGWVAAAGCLLLAGAAWWPRLAPRSTGRAALLAGADDVQVASWNDWSLDGDPPEVQGVTGDVVWSEHEQRGYLRLVGLPRADPGRRQYQLWIIDSRGLTDDRGQSARISGAIFDSQGEQTIVPIHPAIPVHHAAAFAVTIEPPGGVWASDLSRRVVIASLDR